MTDLRAIQRELDAIKASINAKAPAAEYPDHFDTLSPKEQLDWCMKHMAAPTPAAQQLAFHLYRLGDETSPLGDRLTHDDDDVIDLLSDFVQFQFDVVRQGIAAGELGHFEWAAMMNTRLKAADKPSHALRRTMGLIHSDGWNDDQTLRIRLWALRRLSSMRRVGMKPEPIVTPLEPIVTPAESTREPLTIRQPHEPEYAGAYAAFRSKGIPTPQKRPR